MSEKNISIVKQHLEKLVKIVYIMPEIANHSLEKGYLKTRARTEEAIAETGGQKTGEKRQDRLFRELVKAKLESQDAVNLKTFRLQDSLHNLETRYDRFLILDTD